MTAKITRLSVVPKDFPVPDEQVIALAEELLIRARSGEIRVFAFASVLCDGCTSESFYAAGDTKHALTASIAYLYGMNMRRALDETNDDLMVPPA